ncbi:MAG TPA: hypothetical protein VIG66_11070, partial [Noviherbaspirillum sp.]
NRHQRLPVSVPFFQQSFMHSLGPGVVTAATVFCGIFVGAVAAMSQIAPFGPAAITTGAAISAAFVYQHGVCERRAKKFFADLRRLVESA